MSFSCHTKAPADVQDIGRVGGGRGSVGVGSVGVGSVGVGSVAVVVVTGGWSGAGSA
jgi:hypothetical protein